MSLLEQASLVMIPSGYKEDVVYCPKPTDGSGDLTFTRASNGTRVNSSGLVENVPWNLLTYSEQFDNAVWNKNNTVSAAPVVTANDTTAPNGTLTADKIVFSNGVGGAINGLYNYFPKFEGARTASVWLKSASGTPTIYLTTQDDATGGNYTACVLSTEWQRFEVTYTTAATSDQSILIGYYPGVGTPSGPSGSLTIYAWGAQLNTGSTAKPYFPTTDRQNVPRLTYEGGCPSLLLEPQRTNDVFPSEDFSGYSGSGATISTNQAVSPDGTQNADLMYPATSGNFAGKYKNVAATTTGVVSCFVKQAGKRYAIVGTDNNATYTCIFDLQTSTVVYEATNYTGSIEALSNGWYRISAVYTSSTAAAYPFIGVADNSSGSVVIDGTNGIYIWGFQYERNASYPTSYIGPTTSAAVTRLADAAYKTGISSLIGRTEGTIFAEISDNIDPVNSVRLNISDSTTSNWVFIGFEGTSCRGYIRASGSVVFSNVYDTGVNRNKIALAYKSGDYAFYLNGVQIAVGNSTITFSGTLSKFNVGENPTTNTNNGNASASEIVLFKTRLTNTELAALTTL